MSVIYGGSTGQEGNGVTTTAKNSKVHLDVNAVSASYDTASGADNTSEINPLSSHFDNSIVSEDLTNLSAGTHYFPSAEGGVMDYYRDQSMGGKLISSDGSLTLSLQVANSADAATAIFNDVMMLDESIAGGYIPVVDVSVGIGTLPLALSMSNMNYKRFRYKLVVVGVANTVQLEARAKAL